MTCKGICGLHCSGQDGHCDCETCDNYAGPKPKRLPYCAPKPEPAKDEISFEDVDIALGRLKLKIIRAMSKHGAKRYASPCEALGVITEEYHEVIEAVRSNDAARQNDEYLDTAVAAVWGWLSNYKRDGGL